MSLINDALKRATQAQTPQPAVAKPNTPMEAVEPPGPAGLPTYFMPVLLFVIAGACYFIVKGWDARRHTGLYPQPITIQAREIPASDPVTAAEAAAATEASQPVPANRQFGVHDTQAGADSDAGFRLQAIFYRPGKPSAVVNSQTVYIGDTIANGKVQTITRESVTVVVGGQSKVLTLR